MSDCKRRDRVVIQGLKKHTQLELPQDEEAQMFRYHSVNMFIAALVLNYCNHSAFNVVIRNRRSGEYMCNVLITAGIKDIEKEPGVVL